MKVMVAGRFNPLHPGHIFFFEKSRKFGDYLIVVIANDKTILKQNGIIIFNAGERKGIIESLKVVDKAVIGDPNDHFKIVERERPDVFALGHDQKITEDWIRKKVKEAGMDLKVVRVTEKLDGFKSTTIRNRILKNIEKGGR